MKRSYSVTFMVGLTVLAVVGLLASLQQPGVSAAPLRPADITPIGTARAAGLGWTGTIQGNVTVPPGVYGPYYFAIQDATGGIYMYVQYGGPSIPAMSLGDLVQVDGTTSLYYGLLELSPVTAITNMGAGTPPAPQLTTTGSVTSTQGLLIQVAGMASWSTTPPAPGASNWSFNIDDGSGSVQVYVDLDTHIDMTAFTSPTPMTVTGFSSDHNGAEVMPRYQSDIVVPDSTPPVVSSTLPVSNATGVSLYQPVAATFNESLDAATVNTATFTLNDGTVAGTVSYDDATHTASFAPDAPLSAFTLYTATLTTGIEDIAGNALAADYTWNFTTGAVDVTPPTIVDRFPPSSAISVPLGSNVVVTFSEELKPNTAIQGNFTLAGPSGSVGWSYFAYDPATYKVTATPIMLLPLSRYTVTVDSSVTDWAGNPVSDTLSWSFTTEAEPVMQAYHGDLHNHTSYSDGSLTPADAFAHGKAAGYDFMALTDHSYAIDDTEWADTLSAANSATVPGEFVALRGFEYTQGAEGHINVYNSTRHACRTNTGASFCDYTPNLEQGVTVEGFYHWLALTGTQALDGSGTVMQFNHPGWINFNDWTYHPEVGATARLEEVGNGSGTSYVFSEEEFIRSLDYGWKVAATNNADTHSPFWGTNTDHRTGVWMPALTKANLLDALKARRTFATEDKNATLSMKANGAWMGMEIPNVGSIAFDINGTDPDNEGAPLVELISFGGSVVTSTHPASSNFSWQPIVPVTPGVHYFYVKVTQPDGDRIVSSPIWTQGSADVSLTDLSAEPTIATIYNPSLFTARVTNRTGQTQTVTVTFQINNVTEGVIPTTVPACLTGPCTDGFANITWQPSITGPVTITASLSGTPVGDNLDDNARTLLMNATDEKVPLVLIDAGHGNIASTPRDVRTFVNDLTAHGYNVLLNLDQIDASDLNTETVKLLIVNAYGPNQLTVTETQNIANFVEAGGSLWLNGLADYTGKVSWAGTTSNRFNEMLTAIQAATGYTIPVRFNSDEVLDGNDNNGYPWGVLFHNFPSANLGIGMNVERIQTWSGCSFIDQNYTALTQADLGANGFLVAVGDLDAGTGTYGDLNLTYNDDSNKNALSPYYPYTTTMDLLPGAVTYDIPGPAGRLFFYGDANDPFNIFSYTAGDGNQNELFNLETIMWLLGEPLTKSTVAEARAYHTVNQPDNLDKLVWVEGKVTAAYGEFFNVMYVQDDTGGITIHAPAGDISATQYARGAIVRAVGTIGQYEGDTEIEFFEAEQVQVLTPTDGIDPAPVPFSTYQASLEQNQGWLAQITGTVTSKGPDYVIVNDGSGPVRAFLDGYNGVWDPVQVLDRVTVKGLVSEDGSGPRIRVRNYAMHAGVPDDVSVLSHGSLIYLPLISKN